MRTYEEMIKQAADILTIAVNQHFEDEKDRYYAKAEGYAEAITLAFENDYTETWDLIYDEAKKIMLDKVKNGDSRAENRWNHFWNPPVKLPRCF